MMHTYPAAPSTRRGPAPRVTNWTCAECGSDKPSPAAHRKGKYCSRACFAVAHSRRMSGENNPAYRHGRCKPKENARSYQRVPADKLRAVIDWVDAKDALGTSDDLAQRLGLTTGAVRSAASHYRRKLKGVEA